MIFADMGEGNVAPGVAPANHRRQANGMIAYGTPAGLLPALPPNFAAVDVSEGPAPSSDDKGGRSKTTGLPIVFLATRSTTLPSPASAWTTVTPSRTQNLIPVSIPPMQTFPAPPAQAPAEYYTGPGPQAFDIGPAMAAAAAAAVAAAEAAGRAAAAATQQPRMSTGMMLGIAAVATLAAGTGLYIVMKNR